jgi:hypothetical protein
MWMPRGTIPSALVGLHVPRPQGELVVVATKNGAVYTTLVSVFDPPRNVMSTADTTFYKFRRRIGQVALCLRIISLGSSGLHRVSIHHRDHL